MAAPTYQQLVTLSSSANGLQPESMEERILSVLAMLASGQNPDGSSSTTTGTGPGAVTGGSLAAGIGFAGSPLTYGWQLCCADGVVAQAFVGVTDGTMLLSMPNRAHTSYTIDQVGIYTSPVASSAARAGLYQIINQANPFDFTSGQPYATLLADGGQQSATGSGPVAFPITPQTLPAGTWFAVGVAAQGTATPQWFIESYKHTVWGATSLGGAVLASLSMGGVTAALPTQFVPTAGAPFGLANEGAGGYYHRSA